MSSPDTSLLKSHKAPPEGRSGSSHLLRTLRMLTSLDDIRSLRFWKAVMAEMVGVIFLVFVGCGSCTGWAAAEAPLNGSYRSDVSEELKNPSVVQIALSFGLIVATMVWCIGHVSGGHINPAVTAAMCVTRKISLARGFFYVIAQCAGAILGAGVLKAVTPTPYSGSLGSTIVSPLITPAQGVGIEFLITFVLVLTVFASCDSRRTDLAGSAPLTIGLSVTACHLAAIRYTGSSMNPARSFGPPTIMGTWDHHWVYWLGPLAGGVVAGLIYDNVFAANSSWKKARACMLSSDYDDRKYEAAKTKIRIIDDDSSDLISEKKRLSDDSPESNV
ncbi:aquaporin AQPAe.a-like [Liolophura sinensis]|uniref:aquaporin AQPAe.a-like n=1 Tax=Liolophura sinensis TaxID=3198878 RepID=UPI00315962EA